MFFKEFSPQYFERENQIGPGIQLVGDDDDWPLVDNLDFILFILSSVRGYT